MGILIQQLAQLRDSPAQQIPTQIQTSQTRTGHGNSIRGLSIPLAVQPAQLIHQVIVAWREFRSPFQIPNSAIDIIQPIIGERQPNPPQRMFGVSVEDAPE